MDDSDASDRLEALNRLDPERAASRARDAELVHRVRAGDQQAFGELYDAWFDRLYDLVWRIVRDQEVAAEVVQDTFLSAWRKLDTLDNVDAFGGWLLRIARNAALNRSAKEQRSRPIDDQGLTVIESVGGGASNAPSGFGVEDRLSRASTPGVALEDREVASLVWQAAEALGARDLEVLDLQLRHGMTPAEVGETLGLNRNAANQLVHRVRGRLEGAIRARVLWRSGEPVCEVLAQRLAQAGVTTFDAEAVRVIERHVPGCNECDERQGLRLQPTALFAAVPLMVAPMFIKTQACAALTAAGVPMGGSAFAGASIGGALGSASASGPSSAPSSASPAHSVCGAAGAAGAAGSTLPRPGPLPVEPNRSRGLLAIAASILVLLFLFAAGVWWGGRDQGPGELLTATGTTSSVAPTTTATAAAPGTATTTTEVVVTTMPETTVPTTAPVTTTTTRVTTTTTTAAPTTTTTRPTFDLTFALAPATMSSGTWAPVGSASVPVPTLTWDIAPKGEGTITITGPDRGKPDAVLSTASSGSSFVCPGARVANGCSRVADGTYTYTLTVTGPDGEVWQTRTQTLTVTTPVIP